VRLLVWSRPTRCLPRLQEAAGLGRQDGFLLHDDW